MGARAIDFLPHMLAGCFAGVMVGILAGVVAALREEPPDALVAALEKGSWHDWVFGLLGYVAYAAICFHGSTLGKRPLGLVVLNEDLAPCSFWQGLIRSFLYLVDALRKDIARVELRSDATFVLVLAAACLVDLAVLTTSLPLKLA